MTKHYTVIGSGVAGGIVSKALAQDPQNRITVLEAGSHVPMRDHSQWLRFLVGEPAPYASRGDVNNDALNIGNTDLVLPEARLCAVGGSTLHWGGWCPRMRPEDFSRRSNTGVGFDWPLTYEDIEPWYCQAESFLGVSGDAERDSLSRSQPYPNVAVAPTWLDRIMVDACENLGWSHSQLPIARNFLPLHGRPACQTIGTCKYCPIGARFTGDVIWQDELPNRELISEATVLGIVMTGRNASSVEYLHAGETKRLETDGVVVCAGAIESPKILLASTSELFPNGLGNRFGHLGRNLGAHPMIKASFTFSHNHEPVIQELDFPTWCTHEFNSVKQQTTGKFITTVLRHPHVDVPALMAQGLSRNECEQRTKGGADMTLGALFEMEVGPESALQPMGEKTAHGLPKTRIRFQWTERSVEALEGVFAHLNQLASAVGSKVKKFKVDQTTGSRLAVRADHAYGTCRMSRDEKSGVVDGSLRVYGTQNIWICSNAVMPNIGAANPTLTLSALALRLAADMA